MTLRNRLVRSATYESMATRDGIPTDRLAELYAKLVKGEVGLIVTGNAYVRADGRFGPIMAAIDRDEVIPAWRKITDVVHDLGGKIAMQIVHGGRQARTGEPNEVRIAPSPVPEKGDSVVPREMTVEDIREVTASFGHAARRVKEAGFDGVQLHLAHGYLLSEFLSPYTNRRTDDYGGSLENRARMVLEACRHVRETVGKDYPVFVKLNTDEFIEGGLTLEQAVKIAEMLPAAGIDAIETSGGMHESRPSFWPNIRPLENEAYFLPAAERIKKVVHVPVMLVGGLRSLETIEPILEAGKADFICLCRPLIREPHLPQRWRQGDRRPSTCISCNQCFSPQGIRCYQDLEEKEGQEPPPLDEIVRGE